MQTAATVLRAPAAPTAVASTSPAPWVSPHKGRLCPFKRLSSPPKILGLERVELLIYFEPVLRRMKVLKIKVLKVQHGVIVNRRIVLKSSNHRQLMQYYTFNQGSFFNNNINNMFILSHGKKEFRYSNNITRITTICQLIRV